MPPEHDLLHLLRDLRGRLDGDVSLAHVAARSGWSAFHLHRAFRRLVGETPKQYTLRLRLERAATLLATGGDAIAAVAGATGFRSHAVFTRAFGRHFGYTPAHYRRTALHAVRRASRARHAALVDETGPCVGLFHMPVDHSRRTSMPTLSITQQELTEQPVLFVRSRVARHEIPAAIAQGLGQAFTYALGAGFAVGGRPFARYPSMGPGLLTIEVGMPLASVAPGQDPIQAGVLPAGPAAVAVHAGAYDSLGETYAAMERWIEGRGLATAGAPWESYITDPADHPDPGDWRTEVYWPLQRAASASTAGSHKD